MNISQPAVSRNTDDIQHLFEESDKSRVACPLCRDEGHDTTGNNLSIGGGQVHCFRDPTHGDELFRELARAGSLDPHSGFFKPKSDKRLQKYDKLSYLDAVPPGRNKWFDPEGLLMAAAAVEDDLDAAVDVLKRCIVSRDLRGRELLKITLAAGNVLNNIKDRVDHGQWKQTLEAAGYNTDGDVRWAQRVYGTCKGCRRPAIVQVSQRGTVIETQETAERPEENENGGHRGRARCAR